MALVLLISAHGGFIYRHDRPFSLEQVSESKHAAPFVLDVVGGGHGDVGVAQHLLCGSEPVTRVDLAAELLAQRVQWSPRNDAFGAKPGDQFPDVVLAAVLAVEERP